MNHQRDVRAFSCVSNEGTGVGAATGLKNPGHNGPASSCIRYLIKIAMHTIRRDLTT